MKESQIEGKGPESITGKIWRRCGVSHADAGFTDAIKVSLIKLHVN